MALSSTKADVLRNYGIKAVLYRTENSKETRKGRMKKSK